LGNHREKENAPFLDAAMESLGSEAWARLLGGAAPAPLIN
jgi:hypothetical protein